MVSNYIFYSNIYFYYSSSYKPYVILDPSLYYLSTIYSGRSFFWSFYAKFYTTFCVKNEYFRLLSKKRLNNPKHVLKVTAGNWGLVKKKRERRKKGRNCKNLTKIVSTSSITFFVGWVHWFHRNIFKRLTTWKKTNLRLEQKITDLCFRKFSL